MRYLMLCMVCLFTLPCAARSADGSGQLAVITFEEPTYVNMPVWVHVQFSKGSESQQNNLCYPFSTEPWVMRGHDFEVRKDGASAELAKKAHAGPSPISGLVGTCAPESSPAGRLPLHLFYRFSEPGTYMVRYRLCEGYQPDSSTVILTSEWTRLEVKAITPVQRRAWVSKLIANAPTKDEGLMIGDFLPSLLACPDDQALSAILDSLYHPSDLVQNFALSSLSYYSDDIRAVEIPRLIKEKGPTELLAYELSWRRSIYQPKRDKLAASLETYLQSGSAVQVGAAYGALGWVKDQYEWADKPEGPGNIEKALLQAVPHALTFGEREALQPLVLFLGSVKSDYSRKTIWELSEKESLRGQCYICLCWIGDERDLPGLGALLLKDDAEVHSVPYHLRHAFGDKAVPYLLKAMKSAPVGGVRMKCAEELAKANRVEGFRFFEDILAGSSTQRTHILSIVRDILPRDSDISDDDVLNLLRAKIEELGR